MEKIIWRFITFLVHQIINYLMLMFHYISIMLIEILYQLKRYKIYWFIRSTLFHKITFCRMLKHSETCWAVESKNIEWYRIMDILTWFMEIILDQYFMVTSLNIWMIMFNRNYKVITRFKAYVGINYGFSYLLYNKCYGIEYQWSWKKVLHLFCVGFVYFSV